MKLIDDLKWRYAVKKFDTTKKVSAEDLETLKIAIQQTATSYGLEPYVFLNVENTEIREKLKVESWGQTQVTDASHLLVFCTKTSMDEDYTNSMVDQKAAITGMPEKSAEGYKAILKQNVLGMSDESVRRWSARQAYIALGTALVACAELKIDSCPMEGFDAARYDDILGLSVKGLQATLVLPIGYRHAEDVMQHAPKARLPLADLFQTI